MKKGLLITFALILCVSVSLKTKAQTLLKDGKIPKDLEISLVRTACFGSCPDYKLIVKADGSIKFTGRRFTKTKGEANGKITQSQIKQLVNEFETANFFALQSSYSCVVDDSPSEIISIKLKDKTKMVRHLFGCEVNGDALERIENLGKKIDEITNSKHWIGKRK